MRPEYVVLVCRSGEPDCIVGAGGFWRMIVRAAWMVVRFGCHTQFVAVMRPGVSLASSEPVVGVVTADKVVH